MLSGTLPFDSEDDREIARKTIYDDVLLSHSSWQKVSDDAKEIVLGLLQKNKKNRMTLNQLLDHQWIAKTNKKLNEMRRKSSDQGNKIQQFLAYTTTNEEKIKDDFE